MPIGPSGLGRLEHWLGLAHVAPWYPLPAENLAWAAAPPEAGSHAFIAAGALPVGYVRWQVVDRQTLDAVGLSEVPTNAVDIDLLLGEAAYVGRGIGPAALEALICQLKAEPGLSVAGLTSSTDNVYAHRAFVKAGFRLLREYEPPGFGRCYLFVRPIHP